MKINMVQILKRLTSLVPLVFLSLAVCASAFGQAQGEDSSGGQRRFHIYLQDLQVSDYGLSVYGGAESDSRPEKMIVRDDLHSYFYGNYVEVDMVVFNGQVIVRDGGVYIGECFAKNYITRCRSDFSGKGIAHDETSAVNQEAADDSLGRVVAVFNGPVKALRLRAKNGGQALFNKAVTLSEGISLEGREAETSLIFQGPVSLGSRSVKAFIILRGRSSVYFANEVGGNIDGLLLNDADSRASVTLAWPGQLTVGEVKVLGQNRLIFSLERPMKAEPFIISGPAEIDADCLVIDNPGNQAEEGAAITLITGWNIKLNGDRRKIVTKQGDEFELLADGFRVSARLVKRGQPLMWYDYLEFDF